MNHIVPNIERKPLRQHGLPMLYNVAWSVGGQMPYIVKHVVSNPFIFKRIQIWSLRLDIIGRLGRFQIASFELPNGNRALRRRNFRSSRLRRFSSRNFTRTQNRLWEWSFSSEGEAALIAWMIGKNIEELDCCQKRNSGRIVLHLKLNSLSKSFLLWLAPSGRHFSKETCLFWSHSPIAYSK